MSDEIRIERSDGVARVTLNRPGVRNALTSAMCRELIAFFEGLPRDPATRAVVVGATGPDFCSGADLRDVAAALAAERHLRVANLESQVRTLSWPLFLALHQVPQPVIASVRGHAVGAGAQLALAADLVLASRSARFVFPQARLGHSPDHGESWYLPRRLGWGRAMRLLLLGEPLGAEEAERYGLVQWLLEDAALDDKTAEVARTLARGATTAIRETKALAQRALDSSLREQLEAEARSLAVCAASDDFAEAINAFLARRPPEFSGR